MAARDDLQTNLNTRGTDAAAVISAYDAFKTAWTTYVASVVASGPLAAAAATEPAMRLKLTPQYPRGILRAMLERDLGDIITSTTATVTGVPTPITLSTHESALNTSVMAHTA